MEGLRLGLAEVFAETFVFDQQHAGPEQVNVAVVAGDFLDRLFKAGDHAAADAEDLEEFVPESLLFRSSLLTPVHSRENSMAWWRISFHESGMGG